MLTFSSFSSAPLEKESNETDKGEQQHHEGIVVEDGKKPKEEENKNAVGKLEEQQGLDEEEQKGNQDEKDDKELIKQRDKDRATCCYRRKPVKSTAEPTNGIEYTNRC